MLASVAQGGCSAVISAASGPDGIIRFLPRLSRASDVIRPVGRELDHREDRWSAANSRDRVGEDRLAGDDRWTGSDFDGDARVGETFAPGGLRHPL